MSFNDSNSDTPMSFTELLDSERYSFGSSNIQDILNAIINSNELTSNNLKNVISQNRIDKDIDDKKIERQLINYLATMIINNDKTNAADIARITDEELLPSLLSKSSFNENEKTAINNYKYFLRGLVKYTTKSGRTYVEMDSNRLIPNKELIKDEDKLEHEIVIDVKPEGYVATVKELVDKLIEKGVSFNIVLRAPQELHYGFNDTIVLYTSTNRLNDTADVVNEVTKNNKASINNPNNILYFTKNILFGYTPLIEIKGQDGKTERVVGSVEYLLDKVEETINNHSSVIGTDWTYRSMLLKKLKRDSKSFNLLVESINRNCLYSDFDISDMFNITREKIEYDEDKDKEAEMKWYVEEQPYHKTYRIKKNRLPMIGKIATGAIGGALGIYGLVKGNHYALTAGGVVLGGALISSGKDLFDAIKSKKYLKSFEVKKDLDTGYEELKIDKKTNDQDVVHLSDDAHKIPEENKDDEVVKLFDDKEKEDGEPVKIEFGNQSNEEEKPIVDLFNQESIEPKETIMTTIPEEINNSLDKTEILDTSEILKAMEEEKTQEQAIPEEIVQPQEEFNNKEMPKLFEDEEKETVEPVKVDFGDEPKEEKPIVNLFKQEQVEPEENVQPQEEVVGEDDDEPTLSNTGSYSIPSEVQITKIGDEPVVHKEDYILDPEYEVYSNDDMAYVNHGIFERGGFDSLQSVITNDKGETTQLIKYLKGQHTESLFGKEVLLKDGTTISGEKYILTIVIPLFKANTVDNIYTLERVNNEQTDEIMDKVKDSHGLSGFFKKLVKKK